MTNIVFPDYICTTQIHATTKCTFLMVMYRAHDVNLTLGICIVCMQHNFSNHTHNVRAAHTCFDFFFFSTN